jgi:hypothetical protein
MLILLARPVHIIHHQIRIVVLELRQKMDVSSCRGSDGSCFSGHFREDFYEEVQEPRVKYFVGLSSPTETHYPHVQPTYAGPHVEILHDNGETRRQKRIQ